MSAIGLPTCIDLACGEEFRGLTLRRDINHNPNEA